MGKYVSLVARIKDLAIAMELVCFDHVSRDANQEALLG
jgi:hypothetical protein